jgi:hypothetical protein
MRVHAVLARPRGRVIAALAAVGALGLASLPAHAIKIKSTYDRSARSLSVAITDISQNWDDLEIQVETQAVKGNFSTTAPWSVDSIVTRGRKKLLKLKRSTALASDETVVVTHADNRLRGRTGTVSVTRNNEVIASRTGAPSLLFAGRPLGCVPGARPAATALLPYFDVDLADPGGLTTLVALTNATDLPVVARMTLWTDWGVPTLTHHLVLSGSDVVTVNLRDVFNGHLPDTTEVLDSPEISPDDPPCTHDQIETEIIALQLQSLRADHLGHPNPSTGDCAGNDLGDDMARGYMTIDVVDRCAFATTVATYDRPEWHLPGGFYENTATGTNNALTGDIIRVDPDGNFAQSENLVAIPAEPVAFGPGSYTFYGAWSGFDGGVGRIPIGGAYRTRYLNGGVFDGGTSLLIWRDARTGSFERVACDSLPSWAPLGEQSVTVFDEDENELEVTGGLGAICPIADTSVAFICRTTGSAVPFPFGFFDLDLWHADGTPAQAWVGPVMDASGRFSVSNAASVLDDSCDVVVEGLVVP